jgi:hypothetical protein
MKTELSRRATLAGLATIASMPPPALGAAEPDPIFAVIERHHEAFKAFRDAGAVYSAREEEWFKKRGDRPPALVEAEEHQAATNDLEAETCDELLTTLPTTLPGALAVIRYVISYENGTNPLLKGRHELFRDLDTDALTFLTTIGDAIENAMADASGDA